ncbi:acyl-CoA dehydrogenase family protein [Sphingosinicella microcystinivorans]|uniref:acyl-CoA dehydrogenase family protein n=1 Tax=Sphingosinicella microcystinivorans TaxID=335406 RepID=UPI0022F37F4E|nr:acyl-CoA dehydrogenase family protein [Sphingosinicella microcystinivorans]WBX86193.1 acyl-CoA dehydrogenase family protein [Sphingosinicella microcystinivorans]
MPIPLQRDCYDSDHEIFRDSVRSFFERSLVPNIERFEEQREVDREFWNSCGKAGLLCPTVPEEYGGLGLDFRYNAVVTEELAYLGSSASIPLQSDIVADYFVDYGSEAQKHRYLPGMIDGSIVAAIAMTEPGAGSDLKGIKTVARRDGGDWRISGSKTYITSGKHCDVVIVMAKTDPQMGARGMSLFLVDADTPGFSKGRKLDKIGQHTADTSELFFDDVRVPASQLLGEEGQGFIQIMKLIPQERLSQTIMAQAGAQRAFDEAVNFAAGRSMFGSRLLDMQNTRFTLADHAAHLQVGWAHLDRCINRMANHALTTEEACAAKLWHTEMQWRITDECLQLHGGAGYMNEYTIARLWRDARVQRIYGGTSEVLKEVIGRNLVAGAQ